MKKQYLIGSLVVVLAFAGCAHRQDIQSDKVFYTQVGLYHHHGKVAPSNALAGSFVPVNTQVKLLSTVDGNKVDEINLQVVKTGTSITIQLRQDVTGVTLDEARKRMFGEQPVNTAQFGQSVEEAIQTGRIIKGMPKQAVLMAVGYPPGHRTPTLVGDEWSYWFNRYDRKLIRFVGGKVEQVKD
ncbi:hypothetical protein [Chitinivorax sp. B]|uniref:hypothetical protein n=1 Tax=Chitinivorax sp. B TaxID=2502235 RepID=UPI0010F63B63|nr:hypothetical protein [Chitinivorax sp. B]